MATKKEYRDSIAEALARLVATVSNPKSDLAAIDEELWFLVNKYRIEDE